MTCWIRLARFCLAAIGCSLSPSPSSGVMEEPGLKRVVVARPPRSSDSSSPSWMARQTRGGLPVLGVAVSDEFGASLEWQQGNPGHERVLSAVVVCVHDVIDGGGSVAAA